ncbi:MAG: endopeptidase La [Acidobacteria bacterium]|nr:endopeptidase La [Acidobacteriota bacterium]
MSENESVQILPVLPLKNSVLFPHLLMPLAVGRPASVKAVEAALATEGKEIVVVAQREASTETPRLEDLYEVGARAVIKKMARPDESRLELIVLGVERVVLLKLEQSEPFLQARVRPWPLPEERSAEVEALHRAVVDLAGKALSLAQPQAPAELGQFLMTADDPLRLVYLLAGMMSLELAKEQALLEAQTRGEALRLMHTYMAHEVQVLELRSKIASETQSEMSRQQREYVLRQQMRAIQQELGEKDPQQAEVQLLRERLDKLELPEEVRKEAERELSRLERLPPGAPDHQVIRTYLDFVVELPWNTYTEDHLEIARARQILDEDHFNLKEVKERILEHLGVLKLNPGAKAPILCFFGPPGVGKTSLGQSIARALGRKFERMSLGGMHDEAELRGHRRTYIGAMPGRIVQAIRRAGSMNPLIMLDEVDKLGRDFRGDPAAALLEILDPEQNKSFRDNYLDLPFDLSKVFFITTGNTLDTVPRPLLDRMEMLRLAGYSEEEKLEIARRYLVPRQLRQAGLTAEQCVLGEDGLRGIITGYTREAGLRQLERGIGRVARKIALRHAEGNTEALTIRSEDLLELLGPPTPAPEEMRKDMPPGVATGLAWTETGGEVLYVEATLLPGGKDLTITGQVKEVMQESAKAARSYVWANAERLGIDKEVFKDSGIHVHVPAGAIPKDGPSAGITMATALASLYMHSPARNDTAMTGEITLTGLVLPIGGLKEKVLAARRAGIRRVIMPKTNEKDLRDLPEEVRAETEFVLVERIEDVLDAAIPMLGGRLRTPRAA